MPGAMDTHVHQRIGGAPARPAVPFQASMPGALHAAPPGRTLSGGCINSACCLVNAQLGVVWLVVPSTGGALGVV